MKRLIFLASIMLSSLGAHAAWQFQVNKNDTLSKDTLVVSDSLKSDTVKVDKKQEKKKEPSEYEKLVKKGGTTRTGMFTVRHIEDKYYYEVPDSMLGRLILCVTRFTAVPQEFGQFAGEEVTHSTVYFERRDEKTLLMRQYVLSYLANEKDNIARTLEKSTIDPIVMSFKIIGNNPDTQDMLVEVTNLFRQDNQLMSFSSSAKNSLKVTGLQADRTFIDTMKVFPTNIEVVTTRTYGSSPARSEASKTGSVTLGFNTSMVLLPKEPMRKRLWDDRVGYFVNTFRQFSDDQTKAKHESFISRYRLVPKNKKAYQSGKLSEPEKQIVYYIDPATPKKWIPYLKQGIDDWNVAFEAAGFKNAIVAKEWPENDTTMSLDDARFSVLRYLPSETENAYGPRIVDPRSGEIIEAHICWFHNVMNLLTKWYMIQCGPLDKRAQKMNFDDKLMGQLIRFVSSHEVGHTLGLRHNMCASNATPVEKLRDKAWVEKNGHTASIMDYARFNYVAQPEDHISEKGLFPRINDYDKWAIKWGYQWRPEFKDEFIEKEKLMKETSEVLRNNRRLWYLGGEGGGDDPRSQTEDLGDNNMKASEYGLKNLKRVMDNLLKWTKEENDQYEDLSMMYNEVIGQFKRYYNHVMRNIGGAYLNSPGEEPRVYMPKDIQREAVQYIGRNILDAPEWLFPDNIINKVRWSPTYTHNAMVENVIGRLLGGYQLMALHVNACTAKDGYTVVEYLDDLFHETWKPLNNSNEWKNGQRRNLERMYLAQLNKLINPDEKTSANQRVENTDINLYLLQHLGKIEQFLKQQQSSEADNSINALHYQDLLERIQLIRDKRKSPNKNS
jgi:hypothetical protein